jgi:ABC-type sugar transport system substrate-binding protein
MRKPIFYFLGLIMIAVLFASFPVFAEKEEKALEKKEVTVGFLTPMYGSLSWLGIQTAFDERAKELGANTVILNADFDVQRQLSQVEQLIARNVDGIVIGPIDAEAIVAGIEKANKAGIPVVTCARSAVGGEVIYDARQDEKSAVTLAVIYLALQGKEFKILDLMGDLADINGLERHEFLKQEVAWWPHLEIVAEIPTKWDLKLAKDGVINAFQAHPEINAMFVASDYLLPPTLAALEAIGRLKVKGDPNHITIVTLDGDPVGMENIRKGYIDADVVEAYREMAVAAAEAIYWAATGHEVTKAEIRKWNELTRAFLATRENIDHLGDKIWGIAFKGQTFEKE